VARSFTRVITTPAASRSPRPNRPFVSLLTDWGARDPSAAICHGVILGIAPDALIVDISHEVDKYNIRHGALMLWSALAYLPIGSHVAVVDPGVGTARRSIAIETGRGDHLIGPDNGLLLPGAERLGGARRVHAIENPQYLLPAVSATFHGRDAFSPAAAHLALGVPLEHIGRPLSVDELVALDWPVARVDDGLIEASVVYVDTFGNAKLSALAADAHAAFPGLAIGDRVTLQLDATDAEPVTAYWARTFGDFPVGALLLGEDSYGRLMLARNQASAAEMLGLHDGMPVGLSVPTTELDWSPGEEEAWPPTDEHAPAEEDPPAEQAQPRVDGDAPAEQPRLPADEHAPTDEHASAEDHAPADEAWPPADEQSAPGAEGSAPDESAADQRHPQDAPSSDPPEEDEIKGWP
jgi:S-adenosylmethionine hydrolase